MPKMCEIVSNIDYLNEETIKKVLQEQSCIDKWAYILHDKDVYDEDDIKNDKTGKKVLGEHKKEHWHIMLHFTDNRQFKNIASWFCVASNFVCKIASPNFSGALKYLNHANAPGKYQYDPAEIKANFDVQNFIKREEEISSLGGETDLFKIIKAISFGEIREYNYSEKINVFTYVKEKAKIEAAFKHRADFLATKHDRNMKVIFMTGEAGSGKTYFAKQLCDTLKYSYCLSSSNNDPLQDYKCQDALILDDLRDSSFAFTDLLKILDPYSKTSGKARFKNPMLECQLIVITSCKPLKLWYAGKNDNESLKQLNRRISSYYEVNSDCIYEYEHAENGQNILVSSLENPVKSLLEGHKSNFTSVLFDNFDNADLYLSPEEQREFNDIFCAENDILPGNFFPIDDSPIDRDDPTKLPF